MHSEEIVAIGFQRRQWFQNSMEYSEFHNRSLKLRYRVAGLAFGFGDLWSIFIFLQ